MSKKNTDYIQCMLSNGDNRRVGFLANDERVHVGCQVELTDPETKETSWWTVDSMSQPVKKEAIKRGWDNNI